MSSDIKWLDNVQHVPYKRIYSQGGQDGVIEFILNAIGVTNKYCVEFGFNTDTIAGGSGANVARLVVKDGYKALLLDSDYENLSINLHKELLTFENIGSVFKKYDVPQMPDYISIDVDGIDLWLFKGLLISGYKPRLISVEYNDFFSINTSVTVNSIPRRWGKDMVFGASLCALNNVAEENGYRLICIESDAFFIRKDLAPGKTILSNFAKYTAKICSQIILPTPERASLFIKYPSLKPCSFDEVISMLIQK